jgi:hypothetical protein
MAKLHNHLPPLTASELAAIYDENPLPVVLRLLHEINRLRGTITRANEVRLLIGTRVGTANTPGGIWELFERELDSEPCLSDPLTARQRGLLYPDEAEGRRKRRMREGG